ncbi:DUF6701 domain-containing protein [Glaciecola petra]|uniref:CUB domain-containing protein n=1 Tax=Glaciecola petra TaxID=3075602 RepID=A0ABU2ZQT7_9ALTE|nr:DUF6701 domain-containing protein [Aestuariibacter sp. P117]MDT0595003.1 CUB domain-containing protein [Aestuariibacter sp. P117]
MRTILTPNNLYKESVRVAIWALLTGFVLFTIFSVQAQTTNIICSDTSSTSVTGALTDSGGTSGSYSNNETCSFLIQPSGGGWVTLSFSAFDYEDNFDSLSVYDGTTTSDTLLGSFDGDAIPSDLVAKSGAMLVVNDTDFSVTEEGFQAAWETTSCDDKGLIDVTGLRIGSGGSTTRINNSTTSLAIYDAWVADGSPATGLIDGGRYNIVESGTAKADRYDFGGQRRTFSGTLPYPGFGSVGNQGQSDFLVKTNGLINLPAGDYTIFVESDDGFNLELNTLSGDTVTFNKFGGSNAGASNELRFERNTANSRTGGSFTLTQDSVFEIETIFHERGGGDYMEIGIANTIQSSTNMSNYEVLREGALNGAVTLGPCSETPATTNLILEYRFEEDTWNGSNGEVIDNSGNGYDGRIVRSSTPETSTPALTGDPGTCGYASQNDGSIQVTGLPVDTSNGAKTTATFWMYWDGTNSAMPMGWNFHDIWIIDGSIGFNTWRNDIYGIASAGLENSWHHIAVEFTNGSVASNRMYVDGVEQSLSQRRGSPNNSNAVVNTELRVGGVSNSSSYDFHGLIDEFRLYDGTLTTTQVQEIMAERHPCSVVPVVHHYEIVHDGQALTCEAETITINACANADCSSLSTESITLELLGNGAALGTGTFIGTTTISGSYTVPETVTLSITKASVAASNPVECDDGSGSSCDITFSDAGFRFLSGASNSTTIPNQTSGAAFSEALKVQAVENTNGVCTGLFNGSVNVDLSQENIDPSGTSGLSFDVSGSSIAKHSSSSSVALTFGAESIATIPSPVYNDAGQIRLHANYDVDGVSLSGVSNSFWVSPAQLVVSARAGGIDLNGASATATPVHAAGDNFELNVSAVNAATPSVVTPNYSPGQIQLSLNRTAPTNSGSVEGSLSYASGASLSTSTSASFQDVNLTTFSSGISTFNAARYSEVGLINLEVQDSDYGNASIIVSSTAINIGRFIPKYFDQTVAENGVLMAICNANMSFTAYSGQRDESNNSLGAISYSSNPVIAITARNTQGNITQNYYQDSQGSANDFMKLSASDIAITSPTTDQVATGVNSSLLPITSNMNTGTLSQNDLTALPNTVALARGVLHYQFADSDNFYYNRSPNALVDPFTSDIDFIISGISDADGVNVTSTVDVSSTGIEIRFGRLVLENSFGPETANLSQAMQLEHYDGGSFRLSNDNNCQSYDASRITLSNISLDPNLTAVLGGTGGFISGKTKDIEYQASGAGNQGQIGVLYNAYDWLEYDWDNDGVFDEDPSAIAAFGIYRGDERLLHWRENF